MVKKLGSHILGGNAVITKHVRVCFQLLLPIIIFIYNFLQWSKHSSVLRQIVN
jgi:hypothetical protein